MPITHKTRFFTSDMADAPVMTTGAGGIIAVLDGCLLNGFNTKTLSSLSVTSGVATATVSGGHGYSQYVIIEISGSSISALNGTHRVATVPNSTTFTFDATGVANGTATGTITAIVATPTGWTKAFSGTNKAAYKSTTSASGFYFRIDDSVAYSAQIPVRGYESMSDIDTGSGAFPTTGQQANYNWRRSFDATGDRLWALVADDSFFYLFIRMNNADTANACLSFGDIFTFDSSDEFGCVMSGANAFDAAYIAGYLFVSGNPANGEILYNGLYISRPYNAVSAGASSCYINSMMSNASVISPRSAYLTANNSVAGGHLLFRGGVITDTGATKQVRGMLPEFYTSLVRPDSIIPNNHSVQIIDGKLFLASRVWNGSSYAQDGFIALSLDGWR